MLSFQQVEKRSRRSPRFTARHHAMGDVPVQRRVSNSVNVKGGHRKHYADNSKLLQLKALLWGEAGREQSAPVQRDTRPFSADRYGTA